MLIPLTADLSVRPYRPLVSAFDVDAGGWLVYEYRAPPEMTQAWTPDYTPPGLDGPAGAGYVTARDSRWSIDEPEDPDSVLAFLTYPNGPDGSVDLRGGEVRVQLRTDALDLKGGHLRWWVHSSLLSARYHYLSPLPAGPEWAEDVVPLEVSPGAWHRSWNPSGLAPLDGVLSSASSFGVALVGFASEPTGALSMGPVSVWARA